MNDSDKLVEHFIATSYDDLTPLAIERTKTRILDTFGVIVAGTTGPVCKSVYEMLLKKGGAEEATVLGFGKMLPADSAAMINGLMARSFDYDATMALMDNGRNKPAHISASSATTAIVAAQTNKSTGKELITALALGDDLAARLVVFSGGGPSDVFDNTGIASGMGAVVAAAKLYGLNHEQFKSALGIMVNSVAGSMANSDEYNMCFKYPIANSARAAIYSVELAKAGLTSLDDPIFGRKAYFDTFGADYDIEHFFDSFGQSYLSDIVIKPWASCRMTHASIDAVTKATNKKPMSAEEIQSIEVFLHPKAPGFIIDDFDFGNEAQPHAAFNARYTVAQAVVNGCVTPAQYSAEAMQDPRVKDVIELISFSRDEALPAIDIARARIVLKDGTVLEGIVEETPLGDMLHAPLTEEEIKAKFMGNIAVSNLVTPQDAEQAYALLQELEILDGITHVIDLLSR